MGYQLIAVSPDQYQNLQPTVDKNELAYEVVSDNTMAGARAFGLPYQVDSAMLERLKGFGIDLEKASGETHHLLPVPAVYLVGTDGVVDFQYVNPDYTIRLDPEVLLAAAKASLKAQ